MEIQLMRRLLGFVSSIVLTSAPALAQQAGTVTSMPFAATPLSGSELFYIIQGGISKKIATGTFFGQVPTTGNILLPPFNCVADGKTDQTACINNVLATYPGCVTIPPTQLGFYVAGTITVPYCLEGQVFNPSNSTLNFANTSHVFCNNQLAVDCVVANKIGNYSVQIHDVTFLGTNAGDATAVPIAGSIGFQWQGGYNLIMTNVQLANFDTCLYLGPISSNPASGPISARLTNVMRSRCYTHYTVKDGDAETYDTTPRIGENGGTDYRSANDLYYMTKTTNGGSGSGPNSLVITSAQMNPGGVTAGAFLRWGGFSFTTGGFGANKIVNSHIELGQGSGYTGSATRGMIVMDSTVPHFPGLSIMNSDIEEDGTKSIPFFNIDTAVPFDNDLKLVGNPFLCAAASTLTISQVSGAHTPMILDNYICSAQTFTAGDNTATLNLDDNVFGLYAISGQWSKLSMHGNSGTLTDTATGNVYESNQARRTWTPSLNIGGTPAANQTVEGNIVRTPDGGYSAQYNITLTGALGSTGAVSIAGIPYTCSDNDTDTVPVNVAANMSSVTALMTQAAAASTVAYVVQAAAGAAGQAAITHSNLNTNSSLQGFIRCGKTQ